MRITRTYLDSNILLDFYRSAPEPISLFDELKAGKVCLVTTEQTLEEFHRNRAATLSQVIESVRKSGKAQPYKTALVRHLPEFDALNTQRRALAKATDILVERLQEMLQSMDKDPVFSHLRDLVATPDHLLLPTTDRAFKKAHRRKLLGNPPSSPDKWTIGDEVAVSYERRNILAIIGAKCAKEIAKCVVGQIMESV